MHRSTNNTTELNLFQGIQTNFQNLTFSSYFNIFQDQATRLEFNIKFSIWASVPGAESTSFPVVNQCRVHKF